MILVKKIFFEINKYNFIEYLDGYPPEHMKANTKKPKGEGIVNTNLQYLTIETK